MSDLENMDVTLRKLFSNEYEEHQDDSKKEVNS